MWNNKDEEFAQTEIPDLEMGIPHEEINTTSAQDAEMQSEQEKQVSEAPKLALEVMQVKDTIKPCLLDDINESQQNTFEDRYINMSAFAELSVMGKCLMLAEAITQMLKSKNESTRLFSIYNRLLQDNKAEIIKELANEDCEKRAVLVGTLFTEIIKLTHKESYI